MSPRKGWTRALRPAQRPQASTALRPLSGRDEPSSQGVTRLCGWRRVSEGLKSLRADGPLFVGEERLEPRLEDVGLDGEIEAALLPVRLLSLLSTSFVTLTVQLILRKFN